jgi:CheY-like chemotaxis protein
MRILVVEDKEMHRKSAEETLAGHEVTIVKSFDEAMKLLDMSPNYAEVRRLMAEAGFDKYPSKDDTAEYREGYRKAQDEATLKATPVFAFDAVLTDMMMPMSKETLAPGVFDPSEQVPYGFVIALKAAAAGAKFVAVVTDTNHHQGAMSAALDHLGGKFVLNGAKAMFVHTPFVRKITKDAPCEWCSTNPGVCGNCGGTGMNKNPNWQPRECHSCSHTDAVGKCTNCKGTGRYDKKTGTGAKDWGQVLADLTAE